MREIKFRAKDWQTSKWVYGFLFMGKGDDNRDYAFILQDKGLKVGTAREDNAIEFPCDEAHLVDKETIGQYTGLKDKNGKEIYEGDIVKDIDGKVGYIAFLQQEMGFVIVWRNSDSRLGHRNRGGGYEFDNSIEVIGNIHDNPELIKEKSHEA